VDQNCAVSPFVNPAGQPAVILTMSAQAASALIEGLRPRRTQPGANPPFMP
jgi:hypothetical protein